MKLHYTVRTLSLVARAGGVLLLLVALLAPLSPIPVGRVGAAAPSAKDRPPAPPSRVAADAGSRRVTITSNANTEVDVAGYNVYRGRRLPVSTSSRPLNGEKLLTTPSYTDTGVTNGVTYYYVIEAVDKAGNSTVSAPITATPLAAAASLDVRVNFQPDSSPVPAGYIKDIGAAYSDSRGHGWVRQDSLGSSTHVPLSVVPNSRDRNLHADPRLDTLIHMQYPSMGSSSTAVRTPAAWEYKLPNDAYVVKVSVGDPGTIVDSVHQLNIEGQVAIATFTASSSEKFASATRTVNVADGTLTIDAQGGTNTKINYVTILTAPNATRRPAVSGTTPPNGATNVTRDTAVAATVRLPNVGAGVDDKTLTAATVKLVRVRDDAEVAANRNTSGGGDVIVLQPATPLDANTSYRFEVTDGVKDLSGAAFLPYSMTFTTGSGGAGGGAFTGRFEKVTLPTATGKSFSSLTIGPDGKLYASTIDGEIVRFPLSSDGTTGAPQIIKSLQSANGGPRMLIGLAFDPGSTASNLILWTSHSFLAESNGPDWEGKITRLSGPNLENVRDYVIGLPRSVRDHLTNSLAFGPDGAMYVNQGSNSAMGAPDAAWGMRPERLLNAAVLRINLGAITSPPLDVKTEDRGAANYDPFAPGAHVTIYASGVRNAYDLVFHSNRQLYVPANGSAANGSTPGTPAGLPPACRYARLDKGTRGAYTGPKVPGIAGVTVTQDDYLFRVVKGGYYGHPNPTRCEWVLNGGDPTGGSDPAQVVQYPDGTQPDRNWRGAAFDFKNNKSPNGVIEYRNATAFGGALRGKLLVVRYSAGDDIIVLTSGGTSLDITASQTGVPGLTGFVDPLDLTENVKNGHLYVSEFGAQKITLLRPSGPTKPATELRVNAGGGAYTDASSKSWSADSGYSGGTRTSTTAAITNTSDSALYQNGRYGNHSYGFAVPNATYSVKLKFAETYWTAAGKRVFNVAIEGQSVLTNFDILKAAAPKAALDRAFNISVTDGTLNIAFTSVVDNAIVQAIEVVTSDGSPGGAPPDTSITSSPAPAVNTTSASFSFTSAEAGATFECQLDGGSFLKCISPRGYTGLRNGAHKFVVRARNSKGATDPSPASHTWSVDTVKPVARAATASLVNDTQLGAALVPVKLTWSATDGLSGIERYGVEESFNGGAYKALPSGPATSVSRLLQPGIYGYRVRARDKAGNTSDWAVSAPLTVAARAETAQGITYSSGWVRAALSGAHGGYVRYAAAADRRATLTFTGRGVAWVAQRGPDRGGARVYVDGALVASIDLYTQTTIPRRLVFAQDWPTSATHTLEIRLVGTAGRPRVDLDAFVTLR